jgi:hypothetical protein
MRTTLLLILLPILLAGTGLFAHSAWFALCAKRTTGQVVSSVAKPWKRTDPDSEGVYYYSVVEYMVERQRYEFQSTWQRDEPQYVGALVDVLYRRSAPGEAQQYGGPLYTLATLAIAAMMVHFAAAVAAALLR